MTEARVIHRDPDDLSEAEQRIVYPSKFERLDQQRHRDMLVQARAQGVLPATGQAMGVLHQLAARLQADLPLPLTIVIQDVQWTEPKGKEPAVRYVARETEQTTESFLCQTIGNDRRPVPAELHAKAPDMSAETLSEFGPSLYAEAKRRGLV